MIWSSRMWQSEILLIFYYNLHFNAFVNEITGDFFSLFDGWRTSNIFIKFPIIQLGAIFLGNSSFFFFIHDISSRWFLFFFFFLQTHLKLNFVHIQLTFVKLISINLIRKFADTTHESQECKWKLFKSITTLIISREIRQDVHSLSDDCIV